MRNLKKRDFWRGKAYAVLLTYLLFCVAIYFLQGYLLFPAYAAPPVPDDWQPSVGASHRQALHADRWISKVRGPVHAIHGLADTLIAPERAQALMRAANGKVDMEWVKGAGHNDITLFGESRGWLEQSLAAGILPAI